MVFVMVPVSLIWNYYVNVYVLIIFLLSYSVLARIGFNKTFGYSSVNESMISVQSDEKVICQLIRVRFGSHV